MRTCTNIIDHRPFKPWNHNMCPFRIDLIFDTNNTIEDNGTMTSFNIVQAVCTTIHSKPTKNANFEQSRESPTRDLRYLHVIQIHHIHMEEEQRSLHHEKQSSEESQPLQERDTFMRLLQEKRHDYGFLLQQSLMESSAELQLKEKELSLLQKSIDECRAKRHAEEDRLESTDKILEERYAKLKQNDLQIASIQRELSTCCREFEAKVIEIGAIRLSIEERNRELEEKTEQLEFVKNQINERERELRIKQEDCNWQHEMLQQLIKEREEVHRRMSIEIEEYEKDFAAKKAKLCSMQSLIRESEKEMQIKNLVLDQVQDEIENAREKQGAELMELSRRIIGCNDELRRKEEGLEAMQKVIDGQGREAELKRTNLLNSVGEKMKELVLEIESYKTEFASVSLMVNERILEIEKQIGGRLNELDLREKQYESKVNEIKLKEEQLEGEASKLESKEKQIEEQVREYKAREILFEAAVMELKAKADQVIEQVKEFEANTTLYEWRKDELELKEMQYERQVKDLGLKEAHVKVQLKKLESKEKHFEEQVKDLESRQNQFEGQVKNLKVKEVHIKEQLKELESKEGLYKERVKKLESNEKQQEGWLLKLKSKEKKIEAYEKEFEAKEKEFEGQVKDLEFKKKQCEEQVDEISLKEAQIKLQLKEIESKEQQCETRMKDLELKQNQLEEQQSELDKKEKQYESLRRSFANEKVLKENSGILLHQPKTEQLDHKDAPANVEKLPDNQTNELELISDDILVSLQTSSDPAKFVLAKILSHIAPLNKIWYKGVIIDANHIFLLEQLMRISPHVKPQVRDEAMKLALDLKANMRAMTGNSLVVLGFLLILSIYGLASSSVEDEVLKLFEFAAEHKQAAELFQTLGFVDKISDFVQNLVKNQQYIEAVRFICAYKLSDKIHPVNLLRQYMQKAREESIAQEIKAKDVEIKTLGSVLQCISDYKLESPDLVKEIQDHIHELQRHKLNIAQSDSHENHANEEKKHGNEAVTNNNYQWQQYWVDHNNNKRPRTGVPCPVPPSFTPLQQHVFRPLPPRGAPGPNGGVHPQYGFPSNNNNYYGPANTGAGQFRHNGPNNYYQHGPYPRPV